MGWSVNIVCCERLNRRQYETGLQDGNSYSDAVVYCWDDEGGWFLDVTG